MINGFHALIYSDDPDATRAFFRDVLEWPHVDDGGGWLIFKTTPAELGVHPTGGPDGAVYGTAPTHTCSLMCDDIETTAAELRAKDVVVGDVVDEGFGLVALIEVPGAGPMQLYQPRHQVAYDLD